MRQGSLPLALVLMVLGAGCLAGPIAPSATDEPGDSLASRPVVVAVIDGGVNPYHEAFAVPAGGIAADKALGFAPGAELLTLATNGDYEARREGDWNKWLGMKTGQLYAFAGTRLLGISMSTAGADVPLLDMDGHGTGTSSLVAREAPDVLIVLVQVDSVVCSNTRIGYCPVFPADMSAAMKWAAEQPWIDVISVSMGWPGDPPATSAEHPEVAAYLEASRLAHDRGKLIVNAAGNTPTASFLDYFDGPPWVISVGGFMPGQRGDSLYGARFVDVVANYTGWAATWTSTEGYAWNGGTSFAAPVVAGTLANSIHLVRTGMPDAGRQGAPPAADIRAYRDALNASAVQVAPTEWDPTNWSTNDTVRNALTPTAPIVSPAAQLGWGYVHGGLTEEIAARVLSADTAPPAEKREVAEHQARVQAFRETYWGIAANS